MIRRLITSVAALAVGASVMVPPAWPQDGEGLRNALTEARSGGSTALQDAIAAREAAEGTVEGTVDAAPTLLDEQELDDLVAPVALYPDALLAQVLVAATRPLEIAQADQLVAASEEMSDAELQQALDRQNFDPSVLVLMSGFPTVVEQMAGDLDWTERLGNAMLAQDEDVLAAVQRMRAEAEAVGNLSSNEAQVVEKDAGKIAIRPADPDVVYVPSYNPVTTYTTPYGASSYGTSPYATSPYAPYGNSGVSSLNPLHNPLLAGALAFGAALLVQELFDNGDDDNDNDYKRGKGWDDYWGRSRPIDWRDGEVYRGPGKHRGRDGSWRQERDRYWDARAQRWRPEAARRDRDSDPVMLFSEPAALQVMREQVRDNDRAANRRAREAVRADRERATNARAERRARDAAREDRARATATRAERERATAVKAERAKADATREKRAKAAAKEDRARATRVEREKAAGAKAGRAKADATREKPAKAKAAAPKEARARAEREKAAPAKAERSTARRAKAEAPREKRAKAAPAKEERARVVRKKAEPAKAERAKASTRRAERDKAAATKATRGKEAAARSDRQKAAPKKERARAAPAREQRAKAASEAKPKASAKQKAQSRPKATKQAQRSKKKCDPKKQACRK